MEIFAGFVIIAMLINAYSASAQEELTLTVTANKQTYFSTEMATITIQSSALLNESDICGFEFYLLKYGYKAERLWQFPCIKPAIFNIRDLFYEKWYNSNNQFIEPQPSQSDFSDGVKVIVTLQKEGYKEAAGETTFSIESPLELKICTPSSFNPETGAIVCDSWTDVRSRLIKTDNLNVTLNPSTVIKATFAEVNDTNKYSGDVFYDLFATGIAIQGISVISVRADTDGDGIFETKDPVSAKYEYDNIGKNGFRDTIAPYKFYTKLPILSASKSSTSKLNTPKPVLLYITSGEISIDYIGTEKITENCLRKFDSGVVLQRKRAGLAGSTLTYALNVTNSDHPSCSPVIYYRNDWIKYSYEDLYMGDLKVSDANSVVIPPNSTGIFTTSVTSSPTIKTGDHWFKTYPETANGMGDNVMLHYPTLAAVFSVVEKLPTCGNAECEPGEDFESCPQECRKPCDPGLVYSNVTKDCVSEGENIQSPSPVIREEQKVEVKTKSFDYATLLDVAVRLGGLKIKFDSLSAAAEQIAKYYNSKNIIDKAEKWYAISGNFKDLSTNVDNIAKYMKTNKDNLDENALTNARKMITDLENKLKEITALVLEAV